MTPVTHPAGDGTEGRGEERDALRSEAAWAAVGRSQVVWLGGDAGSGKSTLVRPLLDGLPDGWPVPRAGSDERCTSGGDWGVSPGSSSPVGRMPSHGHRSWVRRCTT
jgi:hypothetical protein